MIAAGRPSSRAASAPRVTRLDGSAQCRSSAPITSGPSSASSSARSANASTTRNCRPGSLVTVTGPQWLQWPQSPRSPPSPRASSSPIAARRGSGADLVQPNIPATSPNGRACSSSAARAAATRRPRHRAFSSASWSRSVLPMPASPSISTTARRPAAARSTASSRIAVSASRPRITGTGASIPASPAVPLYAGGGAAGRRSSRSSTGALTSSPSCGAPTEEGMSH